MMYQIFLIEFAFVLDQSHKFQTKKEMAIQHNKKELE